MGMEFSEPVKSEFRRSISLKVLEKNLPTSLFKLLQELQNIDPQKNDDILQKPSPQNIKNAQENS